MQERVKTCFIYSQFLLLLRIFAIGNIPTIEVKNIIIKKKNETNKNTVCAVYCVTFSDNLKIEKNIFEYFCIYLGIMP